jgi:hypothetical protein
MLLDERNKRLQFQWLKGLRKNYSGKAVGDKEQGEKADLFFRLVHRRWPQKARLHLTAADVPTARPTPGRRPRGFMHESTDSPHRWTRSTDDSS